MSLENNHINSLPAVITCTHLHVQFNDRIIINDFTATIQAGEFVGILGPNGAGKTTLFRAILGLIKPTSGEILILNQMAKRGNACIGYMPQARMHFSNSNLNGRSFVAAALQGYRWGLPILSRQQHQEVDEVLSLVAAQAFADRPIKVLSGGEKQRLLLAQALLDNPKILLLDEPLTNLDPRSQENLISIIEQIRQQLKVTILFTAHDVNPLIGVMNRVLYLANGNAQIGTLDEVMTSESLTRLYGIPINVVQIENRLFVYTQEKGVMDHDTHHH